MQIKESKFDRLESAASGISYDATTGYFPTVGEMQAHHVAERTEKFLHILLYFASDPFHRLNIEGADDPEYIKTVSFCKRLLYKIDIVSG